MGPLTEYPDMAQPTAYIVNDDDVPGRLGAFGFFTKSRLTGDTLAAPLRGSSEVDQR